MAQYNESLAGNRGENSGHQFTMRVNPFDAGGNLLPLVEPFPTEPVGAADLNVQV